MQPRRRRLSAGHVESARPGRHRGSGLPDRIGRLQHRIQRAPAAIVRTYRPGPGGRGAGQPERSRGQGRLRRSPHRDDRDPPHADARTSRRGLDERINPIRGPQRLDLHRPRRGHPDQHLRSRAPELAGRDHRARIRLHQHAIASAGSAGGFRRQLEFGSGAGRSAAGTGREFTLLLRPPALVGDPHRSVHAVHRHPARGAQNPGRATESVVRGTVDHLRPRPVHREHPLLPVPAARGFRRGPRRRAGRRTHPTPCRIASAQRHRVPVEPAGLRRFGRAAASSAGKPGAAGRADRRRHAGEFGLLLRHAAQPVRRGEPAVEQDEFRCGPSQFPRGGPQRHSRPAALARSGRGDGAGTGAGHPAAARPRRTAPLGCRRRGARPVLGCHRRPRQDGPQRSELAGVHRA